MRFFITGILLFSLGLPAWAGSAECSRDLAGLAQAQELGEQGRKLYMCAVARKMDVQGHRGMQGYPNNTLESFRAAYAAGAETVELDLQITQDDQVLVAHDPTLNPARCMQKNGQALTKNTLRQMTWSEVQAIACAENKYAPGAKTAPLPLLSDVFHEFKDLKTSSNQPARLNIEIKYDKNNPQYFPSPERYCEEILKVIKESGWSSERFIVQSFDHEILQKLRALAQKRGLKIEVVPLVGNAKDALAAAKKLRVKKVTPSFTQLTPQMVRDLHRAGVKVVPWTPNSEEEMQKVLATGADGIITDRPDLFFQLRERLCGD